MSINFCVTPLKVERIEWPKNAFYLGKKCFLMKIKYFHSKNWGLKNDGSKIAFFKKFQKIRFFSSGKGVLVHANIFSNTCLTRKQIFIRKFFFGEIFFLEKDLRKTLQQSRLLRYVNLLYITLQLSERCCL